MKLLFTHENRLLVVNVKNQVEAAGIPTFVKNEFSSGAVGELSPHETWAELWVVNEVDYIQAQAVLKQAQADAETEWQCPKCHEVNAGSFDLCWNCQTDRS